MSDPLAPRRPAPGRRISIALAVAVHVALAIFLIYGVNWQSQAPEAVEVELVRAAPAPAPAEPVPEVRPEPKSEPKVEAKVEAPPPPPKPEIAIKEKKEKPQPVKAPPPPKFDPSEMLRRDEQEVAVRKEVEASERAIEKIAADQAAVVRDKARAAYVGAITAKIRGNIVLPPDIKGNPVAVFDVTQLPTGDILGVRLKQSSGVAALDAAIERAILKSSPLPRPSRPELFQRSLELSYRPLED